MFESVRRETRVEAIIVNSVVAAQERGQVLFDELEANEAVRVLQQFTERPTCVTVKHREAWETTWREGKEI